MYNCINELLDLLNSFYGVTFIFLCTTKAALFAFSDHLVTAELVPNVFALVGACVYMILTMNHFTHNLLPLIIPYVLQTPDFPVALNFNWSNLIYVIKSSITPHSFIKFFTITLYFSVAFLILSDGLEFAFLNGNLIPADLSTILSTPHHVDNVCAPTSAYSNVVNTNASFFVLFVVFTTLLVASSLGIGNMPLNY